ncbi:EAL domain-containing protein [Herbaspirillum sp. HC18]|nr:EAL domain-containing protein [Herbaspirillum sp. HC18]
MIIDMRPRPHGKVPVRLPIAREKKLSRGLSLISFRQPPQSAPNPMQGADRFSGWAPSVKELRKALELGQFLMHFQPQVRVDDNKITGAEALIRWSHPGHGLIEPAAFLPVAESSGLIAEMDTWMLFGACAEAAKWKQQGFGILRVCINVSPIQLEDLNFPQVVELALSSSGLAKSDIELEITETATLDSSPNAIRTLHTLCELGMRLSIDDFGTGYANFARLCRMPAARLKLDRALVAEACINPSAALVTSFIVKLAHALGLEVTAEGVERENQYNIMKAQGCDEIQGFYFGRPMAITEFLKCCIGNTANAASPSGLRSSDTGPPVHLTVKN